MKIGELATATNTAIETIRFYEREGLIPAPNRSAANYRSYEAEHMEQLAFIRRCRSLDMALDEIRALLRFKDQPGADCGNVNTLLDAHIKHVTDRVRELRALEKELTALRALCPSSEAGATADCEILKELSLPTSKRQPSARPLKTRPHVGAVHGSRRGAAVKV